MCYLILNIEFGVCGHFEKLVTKLDQSCSNGDNEKLSSSKARIFGRKTACQVEESQSREPNRMCSVCKEASKAATASQATHMRIKDLESHIRKQIQKEEKFKEVLDQLNENLLDLRTALENTQDELCKLRGQVRRQDQPQALWQLESESEPKMEKESREFGMSCLAVNNAESFLLWGQSFDLDILFQEPTQQDHSEVESAPSDHDDDKSTNNIPGDEPSPSNNINQNTDNTSNSNSDSDGSNLIDPDSYEARDIIASFVASRAIGSVEPSITENMARLNFGTAWALKHNLQRSETEHIPIPIPVAQDLGPVRTRRSIAERTPSSYLTLSGEICEVPHRPYRSTKLRFTDTIMGPGEVEEEVSVFSPESSAFNSSSSSILLHSELVSYHSNEGQELLESIRELLDLDRQMTAQEMSVYLDENKEFRSAIQNGEYALNIRAERWETEKQAQERGMLRLAEAIDRIDWMEVDGIFFALEE